MKLKNSVVRFVAVAVAAAVLGTSFATAQLESGTVGTIDVPGVNASGDAQFGFPFGAEVPRRVYQYPTLLLNSAAGPVANLSGERALFRNLGYDLVNLCGPVGPEQGSLTVVTEGLAGPIGVSVMTAFIRVRHAAP